MTATAVVLALVAVLLAVPGPAVARWRRAVGSARPGRPASGPAARGASAALGAAVLTAVVVAVLLGGARAGVLAGSSALVGSTAAQLVRLRRRRRAAARTHAAVVEACGVLAANLRVGLVPAQALAAGAASCPVLREAHETLVLGGDVTEVWRRQATRDGAAGLAELARAWRVATRAGASLTVTLEQVAAAQSADQSLQAVVGSELAAPRATGKLMAALPVLGLGLGYLLGGDPVR